LPRQTKATTQCSNGFVWATKMPMKSKGALKTISLIALKGAPTLHSSATTAKSSYGQHNLDLIQRLANGHKGILG